VQASEESGHMASVKVSVKVKGRSHVLCAFVRCAGTCSGEVACKPQYCVYLKTFTLLILMM